MDPAGLPEPTLAESNGRCDHSAVVASLLESEKLKDIEPYAYLRDMLERMVNGYPMNRIDDLLLWNRKCSDAAK